MYPSFGEKMGEKTKLLEICEDVQWVFTKLTTKDVAALALMLAVYLRNHHKCDVTFEDIMVIMARIVLTAKMIEFCEEVKRNKQRGDIEKT